MALTLKHFSLLCLHIAFFMSCDSILAHDGGALTLQDVVLLHNTPGLSHPYVKLVLDENGDPVCLGESSLTLQSRLPRCTDREQAFLEALTSTGMKFKTAAIDYLVSAAVGCLVGLSTSVLIDESARDGSITKTLWVALSVDVGGAIGGHLGGKLSRLFLGGLAERGFVVAGFLAPHAIVGAASSVLCYEGRRYYLSVYQN